MSAGQTFPVTTSTPDALSNMGMATISIQTSIFASRSLLSRLKGGLSTVDAIMVVKVRISNVLFCRSQRLISRAFRVAFFGTGHINILEVNTPALCVTSMEELATDDAANMLAEDNDRLERIDRLYALRLDRYVSLPMVEVPLNNPFDYADVDSSSSS